MAMTDHARVAAQRSRARVRDLPATLTLDEWTRTVADFAGLCAYCKESPVEVLEHFVPVHRGGGTTPGNCLPACKDCDDRKSGKHPDDLADVFAAHRLAALRGYLLSRSTGTDVIPRAAVVPMRVRIDAVNVRTSIEEDQRDALVRICESERSRRGDPGLTVTDLVREALAAFVRDHSAKARK